MTERVSISNLLLASLAPDDFALLKPHLTRVSLTSHAVLQLAERPIEHIHFPLEGMVSLIATLKTGETIEIAAIGREGAIGTKVGLQPQRNATFPVTARGLLAPAMSYAGGTFDVVFDFAGHRLTVETSDGRVESFALKPMTVADFYAAFMDKLHALGIDVPIWTTPCEIENCVPFDQDRTHAQYDPVYIQRFQQALLQANRVMTDFRARFLGKVSPVHFFWGSFDLAVTRFSGRTAPPPKSKTPNTASWVMDEAYSHEVSSCGFWPGNGGYGKAAFYVYAYPEPDGYGDARLTTSEGFYDKNVGQFILPYDTVRKARDPDRLLLDFLQETYAAAADLAKWDRKALERQPSRK